MVFDLFARPIEAADVVLQRALHGVDMGAPQPLIRFMCRDHSSPRPRSPPPPWPPRAWLGTGARIWGATLMGALVAELVVRVAGAPVTDRAAGAGSCCKGTDSMVCGAS